MYGGVAGESIAKRGIFFETGRGSREFTERRKKLRWRGEAHRRKRMLTCRAVLMMSTVLVLVEGMMNLITVLT